VTLRVSELDPHGERVAVVAEDLSGRPVGRAGYRRVYGPRAELTLDVDRRLWQQGLAEMLLLTVADLAAARGISTLLASLRGLEDRTRTLLVERFGAREMPAADPVGLEIATGLRSSRGSDRVIAADGVRRACS
jgi:GNAT superfamily N-acetyltransferase